MMRPPRETKIITLHLEGFVDLRNHLEVLLNEINNILAKGESWLQGNEEFGTFSQINNFLGFEFASCLNKLSDIAGKNEDSAHESQSNETEFQEANTTTLGDPARKSATEYLVGNKDVKKLILEFTDKWPILEKAIELSEKNYSTLNIKCDEICNLLDKMSSKVRTLKEKHRQQADNIEENCNTRYAEINKELQTASDFIRTQTEMFSENVKDIENKFRVELEERVTNIQSVLEVHKETLMKKLEEYENESKTTLITQTNTMGEIKQENECLASKLIEFERNLVDMPKIVGNLETEMKAIQTAFTEQGTYIKKKASEESASTGSEVGKEILHQHLSFCKKNPGHTEFTPADRFTLINLPENHRDIDVYELIKITAELTVKLDVKMTSPNRPEFWPNTNVGYPFYKTKEKNKWRTGSGIVNEVTTFSDEDTFGGKHIKKYKTCCCEKCKHSDTASHIWWEFDVYTATHVVFDDIEAFHTSFRLFYDREDSPVVSVDQVSVVDVDIERDTCKLKCVTCDQNLGYKLNDWWQRYEHVCYIVHTKYKPSRDVDKLNFIVSHPHGCSKQVSVGHWVDKYEVKQKMIKFTYTTCTCPGSAGAAVHCVGYFGDPLVHSGSLDPKLNYSGSGYLK